MRKIYFYVILLIGFCVNAQVSIGNNIPDQSAILELNTTNISPKKGFLPPRVQLLNNKDITTIAKDLKEIHRKDKETSDDHSPLSEALDIIEEFEQASGALKKTLVVLGRQLDMNIPKMDPCDLQAFTNLIEKYSNAYKVSA